MIIATDPKAKVREPGKLLPEDWTLLVIAAGGARPLEPVQLQKSLFLLAKRLPPERLRVREFYSFAPYDYGPFCRDVYDDAERLERDGLIQIERPPYTRFNRYTPTPAGLQRAEELRKMLDEPTRVYLQSVVDWTVSLSFNQLVSAIYDAYPEMREKSVFQE